MSFFLMSTSIHASAETVAVKPNLTLPERLGAAEIQFADRTDFVFSADARWDQGSRAYGLNRLEVLSRGQEWITTVGMHSLSAPDLLNAVVRLAMPSEVSAQIGRRTREEYLALKTGRLTDDLLAEVARRAAVARALQGTPNREVMECFDIPQRTATHWISRAKQRGFLD